VREKTSAVVPSWRTGGFVLVVGGGVAVLHAGRVVLVERGAGRDAQGARLDPAASGDGDRCDWTPEESALAELLTGEQLGALDPYYAGLSGELPDGESGAEAVSGPEPAELPPARFGQVVLDCDLQRWRHVLADRAGAAAEPAGWRWRAAVTPEVPYVTLRGPGPLSVEWVDSLAAAAGRSHVAAADAPGGEAPWTWVVPGRSPLSGVACDGREWLQVWTRIAAVLGSYPSSLSWPADDPGHPLG
jgi:hypothetical protein